MLMALDPRVMTKKEATALILLSGAFAEGWQGGRGTEVCDCVPTPTSSTRSHHPLLSMSSTTLLLYLFRAALAWLLLEGVVRLCLGSWLYNLLYPVGAPLHSKGQRQAAKDVTTAVVNLVSVVHVVIAVR